MKSSENIGSYLRSKRLSRNVSLEEVSESTGISTTILQALENENREDLPAEVYIKAFYKKYAQYLGVDPEAIQAKYQQKAGSTENYGHTSSFNTVVTIKGEDNFFAKTLRRLFLPIIIVILGILIYWIYKNYLTSYNPLGFYQEHSQAVCSYTRKFSLYFPG